MPYVFLSTLALSPIAPLLEPFPSRRIQACLFHAFRRRSFHSNFLAFACLSLSRVVEWFVPYNVSSRGRENKLPGGPGVRSLGSLLLVWSPTSTGWVGVWFHVYLHSQSWWNVRKRPSETPSSSTQDDRQVDWNCGNPFLGEKRPGPLRFRTAPGPEAIPGQHKGRRTRA